MSAGTPLTDAAQEKYRKWSNDLAMGIVADLPPSGWAAARRLETDRARLIECLREAIEWIDRDSHSAAHGTGKERLDGWRKLLSDLDASGGEK